MHLYKRNNHGWKPLVFTVIFFIAVFGFFLYATSNMEKNVSANEINTLVTAIDNAVVSCYATTGAYPENIKQIEDKYGVIIDYDKFIVNYEIITSNTMPNVSVYIKGDN